MEKTREELLKEIEELRRHNSELQAEIATQKKNDNQFQLLVERIPGIVYSFSVKRGGVYYSSHVTDILGYSREQLNAQPMLWKDSIHPDDRLQVEQSIREIKEGKTFRIEYRIVDAYGKWHWFVDRSIELRIEENDFIIIGHALDITDRKENERLLKENHEKYQLIFDTMTEGFALNEMIFNENGEGIDYRILEVNRAFYSIADYTGSQVIGNTATKLYGMSNELIKSFWENHRKLNVTQYTKMYSPLNSKCFMISTSPLVNNRFTTIFFDITELDQAQQKLKESEEKYRFLTENISDVIWILNLSKGKFTYISPSVFQLRGFTDVEALAQDISESLTPQSAQKVISEIPERINEFKNGIRNTYIDHLQQTCKDKSIKWIETVTKYQYAKDGTIEVHGVSRDITERKRMEEQTKRLNMERQTILNNIGSGIFFLKNRKVIWANEKSAQMYGYGLDEIIGDSTFKFHINKEAYDSFGNEAYSVMTLGLRFNTEVKQRKKTGEEFWCSFIGQAINSNDLSEGSIWIAEDITQRKQMEENLRISENNLNKAQQVAHVGSWSWNIKTNQLTWSDEMYKIFGITKETFSGALSDVIASAIHPDDRLSVEQSNLSVSEQGKPIPLEYRIVWPDGTIRVVWAEAGELFLDKNGNPEMLTGIVKDITTLKHAEEQIIQKNKELLELNASKDKFFSIIAHDLKGPFTGFLGLTQLIKKGDLSNEQMKEIGSMINESAQNLFNLLENLLEWSRTQTGTIEFTLEKLILRNIALEAISSVQGLSTKKNINITYEESSDIIILGDYNMLNAILRNLISNSVKFTPQGGQIAIQAKELIDCFEISVIDTGIGIDKENLQKLFRIDIYHTTRGTEKERGSGLGLILCKEFVGKHGGKIWAESELGKGSVFKFTLPKRDE